MKRKSVLPEKSVRAASNTFSLNLSAMLSDCGMAQSELAERIGATQAAVSLWCAGRRCPDFGTLDRICAAFTEFYPDLITGDLLNPMPELWKRAERVSEILPEFPRTRAERVSGENERYSEVGG